MKNPQDLSPEALITCCVAGALFVFGWLVLVWVLTGVALDWANDFWHLGLADNALLAVHILLFLIFQGIAGGTRAARK